MSCYIQKINVLTQGPSLWEIWCRHRNRSLSTPATGWGFGHDDCIVDCHITADMTIDQEPSVVPLVNHRREIRGAIMDIWGAWVVVLAME